MAETAKLRTATSCSQDGFCRKMCQFGQEDYPSILQDKSWDFWSVPTFFLPELPFPQSAQADRQSLSTQFRVFVPVPRGEVYLLDSTFLI